MKVQNIKGRSGKPVANQFLIIDVTIMIKERTSYGEHSGYRTGNMFQSYNSNIVFKAYDGQTFLDERYWDCSVTTGKYRNQFLNETKAETERKIKSGEYVLTNLN